MPRVRRSKKIVEMVADKLEDELHDYHFCAVYRLPSVKQIQPIIIRLNSNDVKRDLVVNSKKKKLNGKAIGAGSQPTFVNEHLSKETVEILYEAKNLRDQGKQKYVWC